MKRSSYGNETIVLCRYSSSVCCQLRSNSLRWLSILLPQKFHTRWPDVNGVFFSKMRDDLLESFYDCETAAYFTTTRRVYYHHCEYHIQIHICSYWGNSICSNLAHISVGRMMDFSFHFFLGPSMSKTSLKNSVQYRDPETPEMSKEMRRGNIRKKHPTKIRFQRRK